MIAGVASVRCSWCLSTIVDGDPSLPLSHGCCPSCVAQLAYEEALAQEPPSVFALYVTYESGYVSVLTFSDRLTRSLEMIMLEGFPVTLAMKDF